ncbi:SDR family oxidoreductase [Arthrobacter russicus]|uniref:NAD(P)-dependent dehydrogenase (Short-subunit alcohol dehydrogenase family) n=1 Tax=Arthrobacter russicus TaxID=172040 RepID=A0ABU1JFA1_9MICC|nr:SDR family oxidoreductase [Arthrobacter russicus]MDN5669882.1 SDR family oxidoreductase [Renibacterium salmoninarum]MDR6271114.1 NAD(P)-dependent dehydrogenase (short-subunit alcohol dehydrogenase family) [Arthrobacter russicus]
MTAAQPPGVVLISGASRGIGAAVALRAARAGYSVIVNYSADRQGAASVLQRISAAGGTARAVQGDVADAADCDALVAAAAELGELTALVNNAAITGNSPGNLVDVPESVLRRTLDVNLLGTLLLSQAVLRHWQPHPGPPRAIVNISSTATKAGSPGEWVHYAASKGAIDVLTRGLAAETAGLGIRVNAVAPGLTETGLHQAAGMPDRVSRLSGTIPMGRAAEPAEVAEAVLWLLSPEASYITGAVLPVSGGR